MSQEKNHHDGSTSFSCARSPNVKPAGEFESPKATWCNVFNSNVNTSVVSTDNKERTQAYTIIEPLFDNRGELPHLHQCQYQQPTWSCADDEVATLDTESSSGSFSSDESELSSLEEDEKEDNFQFSSSPKKNKNTFINDGEYAYKLIRVIRNAIYGKVWYGLVLTKIISSNGDIRWYPTNEEVAIKEMKIADITAEKAESENPLQEIAAMQHLERRHRNELFSKCETMPTMPKKDFRKRARARTRKNMADSNIMMLHDVLTDGKNLYTIMPYCAGGDVFDMLSDGRRQFHENEARYLFAQILNGIKSLQQAGICHLDISLENLILTEDGKVVIADFGACIKIPYNNTEKNVCNQLGDTKRERCLVEPLSTPRGKFFYMSPEILRHEAPFDGHSVDLYALGPILFMMVFGKQPWDLPDLTDSNFATYSSGGFKLLAEQCQHGASADLIELLQMMFYLNPKDRPNIDAIYAHRWMQGRQERPL